jgi:hypothetical protein
MIQLLEAFGQPGYISVYNNYRLPQLSYRRKFLIVADKFCRTLPPLGCRDCGCLVSSTDLFKLQYDVVGSHASTGAPSEFRAALGVSLWSLLCFFGTTSKQTLEKAHLL